VTYCVANLKLPPPKEQEAIFRRCASATEIAFLRLAYPVRTHLTVSNVDDGLQRWHSGSLDKSPARHSVRYPTSGLHCVRSTLSSDYKGYSGGPEGRNRAKSEVGSIDKPSRKSMYRNPFHARFTASKTLRSSSVCGIIAAAFTTKAAQPLR
jgi:hypothetical protein